MLTNTKLAIAVFIYAMIVALRPFHYLLNFDPAVINPPGEAGDFIAAVRVTYFPVLPLLYAASGLVIILRQLPGSSIFVLAVLVEFLVLGAYLMILSRLNMLSASEAPLWVFACIYMLIPVALLVANMRVGDNKGAKPGR